MCAVPALVAGVERIAVATPPDGAGLVAAAARLLGVDEVWALGGPPAIARVRVRHGDDPARGQDLRPGRRLRERGEASRVARGRDRPARGAVRGRRPRRAGRRRAGRRARARRAGRARPGFECAGSCPSTAMRRPRSREVDALAPEHLVVLGDAAEALAGRVRNAGAIFVGRVVVGRGGRLRDGRQPRAPDRRLGARRRRDRPRDVPQARDDPAADRGRGWPLLRPTVEALAAVEGMPAHAAAVRR